MKPVLIRHGSVICKIRPVKNNKYKAWLITFFDRAGVRQRVKRSNYEEAEQFAKEKAREISEGVADLSPEEKGAFAEALEILKPLKVSIIEAVREFVKLRKAKPEIEKKSFEEVRLEFVEAKKADGVSDYHLKDIRTRTGLFGKHYVGPVAAITAGQIDDWLRGLSVQGVTRNHYRSALGSLFQFAKSRRYLPKDWDEIENVTIAKVKPPGAVQIFTPEEARKLLEVSTPHQVAFLALGFFAGIRHDEILRMNWEDINFKTKWITLGPHVVKRHRSAQRRIVPLLPNLAKWLKPIAGKGKIIALKTIDHQIIEIAKSAGVKWRVNAPRHSFISYRLAIIQDVEQVALESGNSPKKIFSNYREIVQPEQAKEWFKITPN